MSDSSLEEAGNEQNERLQGGVGLVELGLEAMDGRVGGVDRVEQRRTGVVGEGAASGAEASGEECIVLLLSEPKNNGAVPRF
jgi:hypothetical protein